jgi:hypothetical protein
MLSIIYDPNPTKEVEMEEVKRLIAAKLVIIDKLTASGEEANALRYRHELAGIKQVLGTLGIGLELSIYAGTPSTYELTIL